MLEAAQFSLVSLYIHTYIYMYMRLLPVTDAFFTFTLFSLSACAHQGRYRELIQWNARDTDTHYIYIYKDAVPVYV